MVAITYECPNCHQHSGHTENCPSWYELFCQTCNRTANTACVEQGHETSRTEDGDMQSRLFSRYTFAVVTGRYKILDNRSEGPTRITQIATADGEDEARLIIQALNQHATLIEQRDQLATALKQCVSLIRGDNELAKVIAEPHVLRLADDALATIEQEGEA